MLISQHILWGHYHSDTKSRQTYYSKRKQISLVNTVLIINAKQIILKPNELKSTISVSQESKCDLAKCSCFSFTHEA